RSNVDIDDTRVGCRQVGRIRRDVRHRRIQSVLHGTDAGAARGDAGDGRVDGRDGRVGSRGAADRGGADSERTGARVRDRDGETVVAGGAFTDLEGESGGLIPVEQVDSVVLRRSDDAIDFAAKLRKFVVQEAALFVVQRAVSG